VTRVAGAPVRVVPAGRVLAGALMAGLVQSVLVYAVAAAVGLRVGEAASFLGSLAGRDTTTARWVGLSLFWVMALVWGMLYPRLAAFLPGSPGLRGLLYGALVWLVSTGIIWPILGAIPTVGSHAAAEPGVLGLGFGGWRAALTSAVAHLGYGWVLGWWTGAGEG